MRASLPILSRIAQCRVLVVGDVMLDRYWHGEVVRISPEAPVPVVHIQREENRLGGAANVALNIKTLGAHVTLLSMVGQDDAARSLRQLLNTQGIESELGEDPGMETIVKLRVIGRSQQMLRIDFEKEPDHEILTNMLGRFGELLAEHDVVLFSDYGKGGLAHIPKMIRLAQEAGKPVLIDPKGTDWSRYNGATVITPNRAELAQVFGSWQDEVSLCNKVKVLLEQLQLKALLLTRSEDGMTLFEAGCVSSVPAQAREVADVTGAGDTVIATLGFVDDDDRLHGHSLNGLPIYAPDSLGETVPRREVTQIFLAIPSVSQRRRNEVLNALLPLRVQVRTLPGLMDLASGKVTVADLRELNIEDLLGREPVPPNPLMMAKNITGKVVMVTGAGGSIGSELCRQIVRAQPSTLLLVELSEFALYEIHRELEAALNEVGADAQAVTLVPLLASVRDAVRMGEILHTWSPSTVYHAAAYKHVPLVEHNPAEGVKNNVQGTLITALQSVLHGVSDFVLVSTDKAVRPTSVMGTSKRLAEMVLQANAAVQAPRGGKTRFSMVRFGNVLGSSGSVVPLFRKQIADGGPITLTDERITRYFMTIPEAAQLVIQAAAMATGGDVFVLDMGEPVKIMDLARRMVDLSGLTVMDEANPNGDIDIKVTGLRPGEKLYEELLIGDNPLPTHHPRIMKAHEDFVPWEELHSKLNVLNDALDVNNVPLIRTLLKDLVPGYQPEGAVVDWVWMENEKLA